MLPGQSDGTFHGIEKRVLFGILVPAEPAVAANIVNLWTRFAKTGNPNGGMNVTWPNYTRGKGRILDINITPSIITG